MNISAASTLVYQRHSGLLSRPAAQGAPEMLAVAPARASPLAGLPLSPADLLKANLSHLFCEADPLLRAAAFEIMWDCNPIIYDRKRAGAGPDAVLEAATRFCERMRGLACVPMWPVSGNDDLYMLRWIAGAGGGPVMSGCHVAFVRDGRIDTLYLLDD